MTDLKAGRATGRDGTGDRADVPVPHPRPPAVLPPAVADGVQLGRLLSMARLTPAQAVELGAGLLAEAARRAGPDDASPGWTRMPAGAVVVGTDGRVAVRPADRRGEPEPDAADPGGTDLGALLADVARAARLRGRPAAPDDGNLLAALDRAVTELPLAGVSVTARRLGEVAAGMDGSAVRAELAALVTAVGRDARPASGAGPAGAPSVVARPAPARRASSGEARRARGRIRAWLLSILVLAGVVLLEFALLRDKVATDVAALLDAGRSGSTPSAAAKPDGLPVVPPAPAAAGSVRGVDLRPLAECATGTPCGVRLLVRVVPAAVPQVVTWSYWVLDRCTGAVVPVPGGSVTVPALEQRAVIVGPVPLPAGKAVGLVAVTRTPAVAASAPLLVGTCASRTG